ncbi:hypothetical protein M0R45_007758 [Rubus argutus]|uniref:HTH OST-type domain-containing protein n=1 Tax=Rubus argutus TaxID=59490 RepID=A0AAW1XZI9_RUBAR
MACQNTSTSIVPSEPSEQRGSYMLDANVNALQAPMNQPIRSFSDGPVAILWDIENCPVPSDVRPEDVAGNIRMALQLSIYLDNVGIQVILVIPSGVGVSSALSNAGKFVWDWSSVARGEGFVPTTKFLMHHRGGQADIAGYFMGCHINDHTDNQNEEEAILYRGISQSYYNSRDFSIVSQSLSEYNGSSLMMPGGHAAFRSHSLPSGLNEVPAGPIVSADQNESTWWVQPGDLNGLRGQLEKLLEISGGCMPLTRVPCEYQKVFGRPLYVSEYGAFKLVNLFKKLGDTMAVDGKGQKKFVYLRNWKTVPSAPPLISTGKGNSKKGKGTQEESMAIITGNGSSDEFSEEERVVVEEHDERSQGRTNLETAGKCESDDHSLEHFKHELQEILVSYSCRIFLGCFEAIYQQRYKKPLDYRKFGVDQLEELFENVTDVVVLLEEPVSKRKFLAASGG